MRFSPLCPELFVTEDGHVLSNGVTLKHQTINTGYALVSVRKGGKYVNYRVHRLVASAYCEGFDPKLSVNHKDGNKLNNHYSNLEWVTLAENSLHAKRIGLNNQKGESNSRNKLSVSDVHQIRVSIDAGRSQRDLARQYGVSQTTIADINTKRSWEHLPKEQK